MVRRCKLTFCVMALCHFAISSAYAVDWVGTTGAWVNGSNWSTGVVPSFTDDVNIDNGGTAQIALPDLTLANFVTLGSAVGTSGALTMSGGESFPERVRIGEVGTGEATISGGLFSVGNSSLFVGGQDSTGTGTLNISGPTAQVESLDDIQLGRFGTGTLNISDGRMEGVFTVVGKFGTGLWNQTGGLAVARQDLEIGDGGNPGQAGVAGPRTGTLNLSGGVLQADDVNIGNRVGEGFVNVSGTGYLAVTEPGQNFLQIGRGADWAGNPGVGGATAMRVTGGDAIVVVGANLLMNPNLVASSSTLIAEITGSTHTPIKVAGSADISNGTFQVALSGYTPTSGDSWTILQTGADITAELATIDNFIALNGYEPVIHGTPAAPGSLNGTTFAIEDLSAALPAGLSWSLAYTQTDVVLSVVGSPTLPCDFDGNGACDINDLDQLYGALGTADATFDLTGDGQVTDADIPAWLNEASSADPQGRTFVPGDTDLDGSVGGGDFTTLASNFGSSNATWGQGNFDGLGGDGQSVGGSDFTSLASNFGFVSVSVASVPEPSSLALILLGCLMLGRRARQS